MEIPLKDTPAAALVQQGFAEGIDLDALGDCMNFLRVAKKALQCFYLRFQDHDLTPGKYSALTELLAQSGQTLSPSDLADRLGITRPSITSLIDGLVRQGLVRRQPARDDRRRMTISLTPAGRQLLTDLLPGQYASMTSLVHFDSQSQRSGFRKALADMESELDHRLETGALHAEAG
jgi:DNA-binding MarR family transcriptional regulator